MTPSCAFEDNLFLNLLSFLCLMWLIKVFLASPTFSVIFTKPPSSSSCSTLEPVWLGSDVGEVVTVLGEEMGRFGVAEISQGQELSQLLDSELLSIPPEKLSTAGDPPHILMHSVYNADTTLPPPLLLPESTALRKRALILFILHITLSFPITYECLKFGNSCSLALLPSFGYLS